MKYGKKIFGLISFIIVLFVFNIATTYALDIKISDISIKEKSDSITLGDIKYEGNDITSSIEFNKLNDFVTYKITLKNNDSKKYTIDSITDNNKNDNFKVSYSYDDKTIESKGNQSIYIKLKYDKKLVNKKKINLDDLTITLNLIDENGNKESSVINPTTGDNIKIFVLLFIITLIVLLFSLLLIKRRKGKALLLLLAIIPLGVYAKDKLSISIKFNNITINGEMLPYTVSILDVDGNAENRTVLYGDKIGDLPTPNKVGYTFDSYVDQDNNEVTSDTIVTGNITLTPKFNAITYTISYDLNGGITLNPTEYTVEDEITLNNPIKLGYSFSGWTGSNGDSLQTRVTINKGTTGNLNYTANWSANQDTKYTVIHKYPKLDGTFEEETEILRGTTDSEVTPALKNKEGFTGPSLQTVTIKSDGTSKVTYTYTRKEYRLVINNDVETTFTNSTYPYETEITLTAKDKDNYEFTKWSNGETTKTIKFNITEDTEIYPEYTREGYKVTYNANGGNFYNISLLTNDVTYTLNETTNKYETEDTYKNPTKTDNAFKGWYTDSNCTNGNEFDINSVTLDSDIEVYAKWEEGTATFIAGPAFNTILNDQSTSFERSTTIPEEYLDDTYLVSTSDSDIPIYMWYNENTKETKWYSDVTNAYLNQDSSYMFRYLKGPVDLNGLNSINVTNMECMFAFIQNIETIDVSNLNTSNVTNMVGMFRSSNTLKYLDLSNFDTSSVINMSGMFMENEEIETINVSSFNTTTVKDISKLFSRCKKLREVNLSNFNTTNVTNMSQMFENCSSITSLKFNDNFITSNVTNMSSMFSGCNLLEEIDISNFDTRNVKNFSRMFSNCKKLETINLNHFDTSSAELMNYMFYNCTSLNELDLSSFNTSKVTTMGAMFMNSANLETIKVSDSFVTNAVTNSNYMFNGATSLVGGRGTVYDANHIDKEYAHIDGGTSNPGYFTSNITSHTVSFNTDGGSNIEEQVVNDGEKATRPTTNPTKDGYNFINWYTDSNYSTLFDFYNTTITSDTIIYAKFVDSSYVAEIDGTYYTTLASAIESVPTDNTETTIKLLKDITETTTINKNQNIIIDGGNHIVSYSSSNSNKAVIENKGTLKLINGTYTSNAKAGVINNNSGSTLIIDGTTISATGLRQGIYNDGGKVTITGNTNISSTSNERATIHNKNNGTIDIISGNIISTDFYAIYNEKGTLNIGKNEGTVDLNTPVITGETYGVVANTIYNFYDGIIKGKTAAIGTTSNTGNAPSVSIDTDKTKITETENEAGFEEGTDGEYKTLYLEQGNRYTVTFNPNSGSVSPTSTKIKIGEEIGTLPIPTRSNYYFDGWYTGLTTGIKVTSSYIPTSNVTLYARWIKSIEGATISPSSISIINGSNETITVSNVEEGYTFTSNNTNIATVDSNGKVTGTGVGTTTITITGSTSGKTKTANVTVESNTYTVTLNPNGGTVNPTSITQDKGTAIGELPTPTAPTGKEFDAWYTGLTDGTKVTSSYTPNANVTIYARYIDPCKTFSTDSWTTIRDNLESDSSYYAVGCEKEVELDMDDDGTNESYTVRLANTSTPEACATEGYSQTGCGVVLEFADIITTHRMNPYTNGSTNGDGNKGGWEYSEMRTYVNDDIYNALPEELKSAIIDTKVVSGYGSKDSVNFITTDKLYLLSTEEVWGSNLSWDTANAETRQLDYYANLGVTTSNYSGAIKKYNNSNSRWWLRSANSSYYITFFYVDNSGIDSSYYASGTYGVAPAFRIGTIPEFTVSFDTDGGSTVASQTVSYGGVATRPTTDPTKTGYTFDNWYTDDTYQTVFDFDNTTITSSTTIYAKYDELKVCAENVDITRLSENTCSANENITVGDGIVCKRAIKLHEEKCNNSTSGYSCKGDGYSLDGSKRTTTITYGKCGTDGILTNGDAFTCDVNGDGDFDELTERFYYLSDYYDTYLKSFNSSTAVLVYYNSVSNGYSCNIKDYGMDSNNYDGPNILSKHLPTSNKWNNVSLFKTKRRILNENGDTTNPSGDIVEFDYSGYSSRLLTYNEIIKACSSARSIGGLSGCNYLLENTSYSFIKGSNYNTGIATETSESTTTTRIWGIVSFFRQLGYGTSSTYSKYYVRPVIEVPKTKISY